MRDKKTYRGARTSAGLKDEYNDVFKARATEMKKGTTTVAQGIKSPTESKESRKSRSPSPPPRANSPSSASGTMGVAKRKRTSYEQKLMKNTKNPKRDVYDMDDTSDEEVRDRGSKKAKTSITATTTTAAANASTYQPRAKKLKSDVFEIETSEEEVIERTPKAKPTANPKYQQRQEQNTKGKPTAAGTIQKQQTKKAKDVYDVQTSEEEVMGRSSKTASQVKSVAEARGGKGSEVVQRTKSSAEKPVGDVQRTKPTVEKPVAEVQRVKPATAKQVAETQPAKSGARPFTKTASSSKPAVAEAQSTKPVAKPVSEAQRTKPVVSAKATTETRNGRATSDKDTPQVIVIDSDCDSDPVRDRTKRKKAPAANVSPKPTKTTEMTTSKADKVPSKVEIALAKAEKRKAKSTSDSESEYSPKPKDRKKVKPVSKETAVKRKAAEKSDNEAPQRPASKRQDRGTKGDTASNLTGSKNAKKFTKVITTKKTGKAVKVQESAVEDDEPEKIEHIYDHAVDLSYAITSPPEKKKISKLSKEPSAVEMPSGLAELIESRVAEIEEQAPPKKAKKPTKKPVKQNVEVELLDLGSDEKLPGSTGERDADLQAQISSAMFAADYGVRTTRSKFRNETAAKKSYGVSQRTMRQPVTEEEQREDDKLELERSRFEAERAQTRKLHNEEQERREQERREQEELAAAQERKGAKKGKKGKAASAFDLPEDWEDGPKVMSRHELLQKGRHQRVLNEINALMEDAQKENPTRRSSILDIAYKMSNNTEVGREFTTKFRLNGYPTKLFKNLQTEEDALTRIGYGWTLFILLNEDRYSGHAVELMHENGGFEMLELMLQNDEDMEELARSSVLKLAIQINIVTGKLRNRLLDCRFIRDDVPKSFSQRYVALMIINTLLKNVSKDEGRRLILSSFNPRQFVEILSPLNGFTSPPSGETLTNFILAGSILSHYAQGARIYRPLDDSLGPGHQTVLSDVLPTVLAWNTSDYMKSIKRIKDLQTAVFKLCIDRTNEDPTMCTSVADHKNGLTGIVEVCVRQFKKLSNDHSPEVDTSKDVDILVLTTILLSNLLEFSETARMFLRIQKSENVPLVGCLMEVFQQRHDRLELAESVEETHLNVAFGYLTVALAYACREYDTRVIIRTQLRGNLGPLVRAVTAFKNQNQTLEDAEAAASQDVIQDIMFGDAAPTKYSYTSRLEDILVELQSYGSR
ncbi:hypothetical protein TWF730_008608 [Orbilia blumenaviensis]|uniref:Wings apart-like protein C-terminal domain-containing protein n=1 Tax=Orbilia blumenaviensis TaxID=1796055 RepID=A0AAV9V9F7_9PEZI